MPNCNTPRRQMEHASSHPQVHVQSFIHIIMCTFDQEGPEKSAKIGSISWVHTSLKGMDPWLQHMFQTCQPIVIHHQGKWDMPAAIIRSIGRASYHGVYVQSRGPCKICRNLVHQQLGTHQPGRDGSLAPTHVSGVSVHCHTPKRKIEYASSNHQVRG